MGMTEVGRWKRLKAMGSVVESHYRWLPTIPYSTNKGRAFRTLLETLRQKPTLSLETWETIVEPAVVRLHSTTTSNCSVMDIGSHYWIAYKELLRASEVAAIYNALQIPKELDAFQKAMEDDLGDLEKKVQRLHSDLDNGMTKDATTKVELCAILSRKSVEDTPPDFPNLFHGGFQDLETLFESVNVQARSVVSGTIKLRLVNVEDIRAKRPGTVKISVGAGDTLGCLNFPKMYGGKVMRFYKRETNKRNLTTSGLFWSRLEDTLKISDLERGERGYYEAFFVLVSRKPPDFVIAMVEESDRVAFPSVIRFKRRDYVNNPVTVMDFLQERKAVNTRGAKNLLVRGEQRQALDHPNLMVTNITPEDCCLILDHRFRWFSGKLCGLPFP